MNLSHAPAGAKPDTLLILDRSGPAADPCSSCRGDRGAGRTQRGRFPVGSRPQGFYACGGGLGSFSCRPAPISVPTCSVWAWPPMTMVISTTIGTIGGLKVPDTRRRSRLDGAARAASSWGADRPSPA